MVVQSPGFVVVCWGGDWVQSKMSLLVTVAEILPSLTIKAGLKVLKEL